MENSPVPVDEIVPRGRQIYKRSVRPKLGPEHEGSFVVIDVKSGDFEVSKNEDEASARAEEKHPGALFFFSRVGPKGISLPAHRIGSGTP